jgi:hypothetical protein
MDAEVSTCIILVLKVVKFLAFLAKNIQEMENKYKMVENFIF